MRLKNMQLVVFLSQADRPRSVAGGEADLPLTP